MGLTRSPPDLPNVCVGKKVNLCADPRSVQAYLHGCDDGRIDLYIRFRRFQLRGTPGLDFDVIDERYRQFEVTTYNDTCSLPVAWRARATAWLMHVKLCLTRPGAQNGWL